MLKVSAFWPSSDIVYVHVYVAHDHSSQRALTNGESHLQEYQGNNDKIQQPVLKCD
jgi:hypothetical protein